MFTGEGEFEFCFDNKSSKKLLEVNPKFFRENETPPLMGSHQKLSTLIGRNPKADIFDLVRKMYQIDLSRLRNINL